MANKEVDEAYRRGKRDGYELHQYIQKQLEEEQKALHYPHRLIFIGGIVLGAMLEWLVGVVFL